MSIGFGCIRWKSAPPPPFKSDSWKTDMKDPRYLAPHNISPAEHKEPDWTCQYCDCINPATEYKCHICGAPRKEQKHTVTTGKGVYDLDALLRSLG